ncbi:MAG: hypothetical protein P1U86_22520 [Verrucomicrobiales bacterium]|nr:hypothetical protein [Verrucomicrobiales bacterium]
MNISNRLTQLAIFAAALAFITVSPLAAQEKKSRLTAELPIFKALNGNRVETGVLIPGADATAIQGSAISTGRPIIAGLWYEIEGKATYGPVEWIYRWTIRFQENEAKNLVYGIYIDTMGQKTDYEGFYDEEENRIQLIGKLPGGGTGRFQMTLQDDGNVRIESVNFDPEENPTVRYSAENTVRN